MRATVQRINSIIEFSDKESEHSLHVISLINSFLADVHIGFAIGRPVSNLQTALRDSYNGTIFLGRIDRRCANLFFFIAPLYT